MKKVCCVVVLWGVSIRICNTLRSSLRFTSLDCILIPEDMITHFSELMNNHDKDWAKQWEGIEEKCLNVLSRSNFVFLNLHSLLLCHFTAFQSQKTELTILVLR